MKKLLLILILLVSIGSVSADVSDFGYYKIITINQTMVNQTIGDVHYTLLVNTTDTDLSNSSQADGDDIVFYDADNVTQLDHQISTWNSTIGHLKAYVNVTDPSNVTSINMYYNNSTIANSEDKAGTWGANASGIWLMDEGTGSYANDSSGNANHCTIHGADWVVDGLDFVAANHDYANKSVTPGWLGYPNTIVSLFKTPASGSARIVNVGDIDDTITYFALDAEVENDFTYWFRSTNLPGNRIIYTSETPTASTEYMMVGVSPAIDDHRLYIDGNFKDNSSFSEDVPGVDVIGMGALIRSGNIYSDVTIYCVYIYNRALSADEINTQYNNTKYPSLFISFGTEQEQTPGADAPSITSYAPLGTIWPEVNDSQLFNVTVNQTTQCRWYINGSLTQTNATPSLTHAYTNTSLNGGGTNITAVVNNTNGTDSQTWIFEVGADSISYIILSEDDTNLTCLIRWNVTRIGSNVTHWNTSYSNTTDGYTYYFNFDNDTEILNQTAAADDETLWFNSSTLLPVGIYYINGTTGATNQITLYANEYAAINNWTADQTFSQIAANVSNDVVYSYYNSTSGLWEAYRAGYTYNANAIVPKNCSAFVFVSSQTTMSATPNTGGVTITQDAWFYGYLPGSAAKTLTQIETAMDSDGLDVWSLYGWNNATQAYTATGSYSVSPNEGYAAYVNTTGEYTP